MFDLIIIALPSAPRELGLAIKESVATSACDVAIVSEHELALAGFKSIDHVAKELTLPVTSSPMRGEYFVHKLIFDKIVAFLLLVLLAPVIIFIVILIRDSRGPAFFRQTRR